MIDARQQLQQNIWTVAGSIIITLLLFVVVFLFADNTPPVQEFKSSILPYFSSVAHLAQFPLFVVQFLLLASITTIVRYLEETNNLFRKKSILTLAFTPLILFGSGSWTVVSPVSVFALFFVLTLIWLLKEYRSLHPERTLFYVNFAFALFSMLDVYFLYLIPAVWIAMGLLKVLKIRTLLITLFGIFIPYLYYLGTDFYLNGSLDFTAHHFGRLINHQEAIWNTQSAVDLVYWSVIALYAVIAIINFFMYAYKERQRVRDSLLILFWFWIFSLLLLIFKCGEFAYIESLFLIISTLFICHFFTNVGKRVSTFLFYIFTLFLIIYPVIRIVWNY